MVGYATGETDEGVGKISGSGSKKAIACLLQI